MVQLHVVSGAGTYKDACQAENPFCRETLQIAGQDVSVGWPFGLHICGKGIIGSHDRQQATFMLIIYVTTLGDLACEEH